ncbi:MAG: hypothetical protein LPD71_00340 [Shewanella sp.]|nr:hypothetical protein [Shewanella sp.]MCF1431920.1 hypothetical protein [Shewanella sp.]MCF1437249.1 hypothetical protein [Shewanella sp.]MCF1459059.1 hypothetical protein [Shewanella sp.]
MSLKVTADASRAIVTQANIFEPNQELMNGIGKTGLSGVTGEAIYFYMPVPPGATNLKLVTQGGNGNVPLYVNMARCPQSVALTAAAGQTA